MDLILLFWDLAIFELFIDILGLLSFSDFAHIRHFVFVQAAAR
jgi:hypothetical protein